MIRLRMLVTAAIVVTFGATANAADDDAMKLLKRYDQLMSPPFFEADTRMVAHRSDGTTRSYKMHVQKAGNDKLRASFLEPANAKGQEMLRNGENLWVYIPSLKRPTRLAAREQFMGGDFNNADVLRVNYEADYDVVLGKSDKPDQVLLVLKAKAPSVAYDSIKLWMTSDPKEPQPVRAELYASSGKLLRTAEFSEVKELSKGWKRPTKLVMKNALEPARYSEMVWDAGVVRAEIPAQRFVLDDLGR